MSSPQPHMARIGPHVIGPGKPLVLIAGPCVIESREHTLRMAEALAAVAKPLEIPLVFKASFDKANRTSLSSYRGPGLEAGLAILAEVRREIGTPVLSDIHEPAQAAPAGEVLDCLQIPAFLCRQTDLLVAAARTGKCVNIKKGQFVGPEKMQNAVAKVREAGNDNVLLTERGTTFGYERLINDFAAFDTLRRFAPLVFDATHSVQMPGTGGGVTGGQRDAIPPLTRAAVATGIDALFMEVHDNPPKALSDASSVWPLDQLAPLLETVRRIRAAVSA